MHDKNKHMNTLQTHTEALDTAVKAALAAGQLIRGAAGNLSKDAIREKNVNDIVTEMDLKSQELIVETLKTWNPEATYLAEEGDLNRIETGGGTGYRWIIDPIDGTTNFTHGFPPYSVSIGLEYDGELVVGVVLEVSHWELFTAIKGQGMRINGVRGYVSKTSAFSESLLVTGLPYKEFSHVDTFQAMLKSIMKKAQGVRRTGSAAADLAYVAAGRIEGFFETGINAWDLAAGVLLVKEAGGKMTNYSGEADRIYDGQVVATNGLIHDDLLEHVAVMKAVRI